MPSRPRDAQQARQVILDAAENEFAQHGFDGARIDRIAEFSGYNKSLIFQYFLSKENLYKATIERLRQRMDAAFLSRFETLPVSSAENVQAVVGEALRHIFNSLLEYPNAQKILRWVNADGWQVYSAPTSPEPLLEFGMAFFETAQQQGWVRPELDKKTLVMLMMTLPPAMISGLPRFQTTPSQSDLVNLRENLVQVVLAAITPSPAPQAVRPAKSAKSN
jgi:TetR/AcrR family transcriptional regulator